MASFEKKVDPAPNAPERDRTNPYSAIKQGFVDGATDIQTRVYKAHPSALVPRRTPPSRDMPDFNGNRQPFCRPKLQPHRDPTPDPKAETPRIVLNCRAPARQIDDWVGLKS
jgi:hypothetical protein